MALYLDRRTIMTDKEAMDAIAALMSGTEWDADTTEAIAALVQNSGRELAEPGQQGHEHTWRLAEDGYTRTWHTVIDKDADSITAYYGGSEDFSDDGDGDLYLECSSCLKRKELHPDIATVIDWR